MFSLRFEQESYALRGAIFEVFRECRPGLNEKIYHECLCAELSFLQIPFVSEPTLNFCYKGMKLTCTYQPDIICYDQIILELKAVAALAPEHHAQLLNYLRISKLPLGFLVNFGSQQKAEIHRYVM